MAKNVYKKDKAINRLIYYFLYLLKVLGIGVIVAGIFVGMSYLLIRSYRYLTTSKLFVMKKIEVRHLHYLTKKEVLSLAGIDKGVNIFKINLTRVKRTLLRSPWIKGVMLRRVVPDKIVIDVDERVPVFVKLYRGRLWYVDRTGGLIAPMDTRRIISLPLLDTREEDYSPKIYGFLSQIGSYLPLTYIGWIRITETFVRCYDYKRDILWVFDRDYLTTEKDTAEEIWQDLMKRGEKTGVKRILVIKNLGWVTHKNMAG